MCTIIVVHSTAVNSSDNLPSYPPDNHHSSDDVYWRGGGIYDVKLWHSLWYSTENFLHVDATDIGQD